MKSLDCSVGLPRYIDPILEPGNKELIDTKIVFPVEMHTCEKCGYIEFFKDA